jgi:hypothetical protein
VTNATALANAKPRLAFTHYPGCMLITDQPVAGKPLQSPPKLVQLSREGEPLFVSVLGEEVAELFPRLEQVLLEDPGTTGASLFFQLEVKEGTDGLPGALALAQALCQLGKKVALIVDSSNATLFNLVADYVTLIGGLRSKISVVLLDGVQEKMRDEGRSTPLFDCLVAVGRVGRNRNGAYLSRDGADVSEYVDPIDSLFEEAQADPRVTTIGIGSRGNEIGMGKVGERVGETVGDGSEVGCVVESDRLIAVGVANWAGHALAAGLYAVSQCPLHWRYRNQGVDAETPPTLDINDFVNSERFSSTLQYMNSVGVRDGVTGSLDQSVGGVQLSVHLDKMQEMRDIVETIRQRSS